VPVVTGHHKTRPLVVRFLSPSKIGVVLLRALSGATSCTGNSARGWLRLKLRLPKLLTAGGKGERFDLPVTPVSSHRVLFCHPVGHDTRTRGTMGGRVEVKVCAFGRTGTLIPLTLHYATVLNFSASAQRVEESAARVSTLSPSRAEKTNENKPENEWIWARGACRQRRRLFSFANHRIAFLLCTKANASFFEFRLLFLD
jgi:hypothetical protein